MLYVRPMETIADPSPEAPALVGPRIQTVVALLMIAGVPIVWSFQLTLDSYNRPKLAFLVAGVATMAALALARAGHGATAGAWRVGVTPALAILAPLALSWLASPYKEWAVLGQYGRLQGLFPYLVIAAFGLLAMAALDRQPRKVAWAIAIAGGVAGSYSLVQAAGLDPFVYATIYRHSSGLWTAQSTLGNINFAGAFFALAAPVAIALTRADRGRRGVAAVLLGLIVVGLAVSFSQGPWGAAVGGTAVTVGYWFRPRWRHAAIGGGLVAAAVAVVFVGAVFAGGADARDLEAPVTSAGARYWYWEAAVSIGAEDLLTGGGPNAYAVEALRHMDPQWVGRVPEFPDDPHSVPLAFFANAGVPGLLGYLLFVAWGLRLGVRVARRNALGAGLLGAFVAYCIVSLVSLNELTLNVVVWSVFVALVGLDRSTRTPRSTPAQPSSVRRRVPALAAASLIFLGGWWVAVRSIQTDRQMLRGEMLALDNDAPAAVAAFRSGLSFWDEYRYRELAGRRIGELGARRAPAGGHYIAEMNRVFGYLDGFPDVRGLISQARLLHVWAFKTGTRGPDEEALALFERARRLDPYSPRLAAETAQVLGALGRGIHAIELLETYVPREPPVGAFWAELAYQYEAAGRHEDALGAVMEGLERTPTSTSLLRAAEVIGVEVPH